MCKKQYKESDKASCEGLSTLGLTAIFPEHRANNKVAAKIVEFTDKTTPKGFVKDNSEKQAVAYSDDASADESLPFDHETARHSLSKFKSRCQLLSGRSLGISHLG